MIQWDTLLSQIPIKKYPTTGNIQFYHPLLLIEEKQHLFLKPCKYSYSSKHYLQKLPVFFDIFQKETHSFKYNMPFLHSCSKNQNKKKNHKNRSWHKTIMSSNKIIQECLIQQPIWRGVIPVKTKAKAGEAPRV